MNIPGIRDLAKNSCVILTYFFCFEVSTSLVDLMVLKFSPDFNS